MSENQEQAWLQEIDNALNAPTEVAVVAPTVDDAAALDALREILFGHYHGQIDKLQADLTQLRSTFDQVETQFKSDDLLAQRISPIIAPAIMSSIHESREAMVEALYPIIGQMVLRAVTEAMRDLARRIDYQMRSTLSIASFRHRLQARIHGVDRKELILRQALPFQVEEVFLIHRASGLLLNHLAHDEQVHVDSDLISAMLTAIHDFAQDALGRDDQGQLNQIQYGGKVILLESAQNVYIATVIQGIEPPGYRAEMREQAINVELEHNQLLRNYTGDASPFAASTTRLTVLMRSADMSELPANKADSKAGAQLVPPKPPATSQAAPRATGLVLGLGLLAVIVFLALLLIWQLQSIPFSLFNLIVRSHP